MKAFTERQIEIIEAATKRIDQHGIQNLTIKNLAADIGLSEPALYRHFKSKNDILLSVLNYFILGMQDRLDDVFINPKSNAAEELRAIFSSQLQAFEEKPAIISVIFAESIFHFNKDLSEKVSEIMDLMHKYVIKNIKKGQEEGNYSKMINSSILTTIVIGGMRMTVLKWKMSSHKSNLKRDGLSVLDGILKMMVIK